MEETGVDVRVAASWRILGIRRVELRILLMSWGSVGISLRTCVILVGRQLTTRLKKLNNGPNGDVLERRIWACQETIQVLVHAAIRLVPNVIKCRVVIGSRAAVCSDEFC